MQTDSKKEILVTGLFTALFLLGGFIHVIAGPWDFTSCIAQIYYSTLVLIWAATINYRIVNPQVRRLMLITAALFLLAFFLQMCRYRIFEAFPTACRFFWYGYYIPVILVPVLFLFVVLHLHLQEGETPPRGWHLMWIPAAVLLLLVVTNDLHQLIFVFTEGSLGKVGTYTHGLLFYGIYVWVAAVLLLSLYLAIRKCRIPSIGKKLWMPLYFASFGILNVLSMFDLPKIDGISVWLFIECMAMIIIGMEEACIQLGLIPANSRYLAIARLAGKPFLIADESGTPVYAARSAWEMMQQKDSVRIYTKSIKGGSVSWAVDLSDLMQLNREIEKATESIESRNEYLKTENSLKEEQSRLGARNALYNQIAAIVSPQLDTIEELLQGPDEALSLAKLAFLNAYIKRRSNMELLRSDRKQFPTGELASAIRESCEYLKLCGVNAMLHITPEQELSPSVQISLYEAFEIAVEGCLDGLELLLVNITVQKEQPVLRLAVKGSGMDPAALQRQISCGNGIVCTASQAEEGEFTLSLAVKEGGQGI